MYETYLWTVMWCNMWWVVLNLYDLGLYVGCLRSFVTSLDYRAYMGSSMTVWSLRWLLLYLCCYKLDGSITWAIAGLARPHVGVGAVEHEARPWAKMARAAWATLAFSISFSFLNPFLFVFPISIYTLGTYACIHVLPSMYTSLWGPLGVN